MLSRPDDPTYDPALVASLIADALPELAHGAVASLDRGWDCDVFTLGKTHVVRVARNPSASSGISLDARLLPVVRTQLTLPVPAPVYLGRLPGDPGLCFGVYHFLPGVPLCEVALGADDYAELAPALGHFIRSLHVARLPADLVLPDDQIGRLDPARRTAATRATLAQLLWEGALTGPVRAHLEAALALAEQSPLSPSRVLVHGDLHPCNMLVGEHGFSGIIDWVDAHRGHPATDLATAFLTLPPATHAALFAAYGDLDAHTLAWARWRAITWLTVALKGSRARGDGSMAQYCVARLQAAGLP
jgi:aminoglycoside phosphotransferase (APT) family kinase protein